MICQVCTDALEFQKGAIGYYHEWPGGIGYVRLEHHPTVASLEKSAAALCQFCYPVWDRLDTRQRALLVEREQALADATTEPELPGLTWSICGTVVGPGKSDDLDKEAVEELVAQAKASCAGLTKLVVMQAMPDSDEVDDARWCPLFTVKLDLTDVFTEGWTSSAEVLLKGDFLLQSHGPVPGTPSDRAETLKPSSTKILPTPIVSDDTSSQQCWSTATAWLNRCATSHSKCKSGSTSWYPTRVLDVGASGQDTAVSERVRVVVTAEDGPLEGPYATLSHTWGLSQPIRLLKSTIDSFREGIPTSDLPTTFKDAIDVVRKLGIRYLWIDSLCILQDSDELSDWKHEAPLMKEVYSNSYVNISAMASHGPWEGLFRSRSPETFLPSPVRLGICQIHPLARYNSNSEIDFVDCDVAELKLWEREISQSPINRRGWVLQERLLAPRVLGFGRRQLFWECRELTASETYPEGIPGILKLFNEDDAFKSLDPQLWIEKARSAWSGSYTKEEFKYDEASAYQDMWRTIVEQYSRCRLTRPQDKLIALAGIAKHFREATNDTYVAGMWRHNLAHQLTWHVTDANASARQLEDDSLPSFSWTSVTGPVSPGSLWGAGKILFEVVDAYSGHGSESVSDEALVAATGAYVDLKVVLGQCRLVVDTKEKPEKSKLKLEIKGDDEGELFALTVLLDVQHRGDSAESEQDKPGSPYFYFPARHRVGLPGWAAVIILELADREQGLFRRIGWAYGFVQGNAANPRILQAGKYDEGELPCRQFGDGKCIIRLV